jgi:outer membrane protein assembly factor BamD
MGVCASCGGPYKAKTVSLPDEKLAVAQKLFDREKYSAAATEYKDFISTFAGDERSDFAQYRLAECYRLSGDFALAAVEYRILITDYGYSEYVDDAFFLEGVCHFEQSQRSERDQTEAYTALSKINRFLQLFPDSPRRAEAEAVRGEIHDKLGKKHFLNARLYFRGGHYTAAGIYFEKVVSNYPETIWALRSRYFLGLIHEKRGETEAAIESLERAVADDRGYPEKAHAQRKLRALSKDAQR